MKYGIAPLVCEEYLSWIVTLDVLKFDKSNKFLQAGGSWIVTLDVLKSGYYDLMQWDNYVE